MAYIHHDISMGIAAKLPTFGAAPVSEQVPENLRRSLTASELCAMMEQQHGTGKDRQRQHERSINSTSGIRTSKA